jgi:hypothetical protein
MEEWNDPTRLVISHVSPCPETDWEDRWWWPQNAVTQNRSCADPPAMNRYSLPVMKTLLISWCINQRGAGHDIYSFSSHGPRCKWTVVSWNYRWDQSTHTTWSPCISGMASSRIWSGLAVSQASGCWFPYGGGRSKVCEWPWQSDNGINSVGFQLEEFELKPPNRFKLIHCILSVIKGRSRECSVFRFYFLT